MIDGWGQRKLEPFMAALARRLAGAGVSANMVTLSSLVVGVAAAIATSAGYFLTALALILLSRLGDGLDGAVARVNGRTDLGGYLDIVFDFFFYGAVPLGFVLYDPGTNGVPGAVLLLSFYINGASFLAYAAVAERRRMATEVRGQKSFFFTTGLAEAGETLIVFVLGCLFPAWFPALAYLFAVLTLYTAVSRIVLATRMFR